MATTASTENPGGRGCGVWGGVGGVLHMWPRLLFASPRPFLMFMFPKVRVFCAKAWFNPYNDDARKVSTRSAKQMANFHFYVGGGNFRRHLKACDGATHQRGAHPHAAQANHICCSAGTQRVERETFLLNVLLQSGPQMFCSSVSPPPPPPPSPQTLSRMSANASGDKQMQFGRMRKRRKKKRKRQP